MYLEYGMCRPQYSQENILDNTKNLSHLSSTMDTKVRNPYYSIEISFQKYSGPSYHFHSFLMNFTELSFFCSAIKIKATCMNVYR